MKIKTLLLGTVAAAGLSTAAMAADPAVLTSLDICSELGVTGLTISSDDNCLQISGGVTYEFNWGDYASDVPTQILASVGWLHAPDDNDGVSPLHQDWSSDVDAWLKFVATADSDFGPAKAVIKLTSVDLFTATNSIVTADAGNGLSVSEAYVSVGSGTVLSAGRKGTMANLGHDTAYDWLGLRHDDFGLGDGLGAVATGGHVIQLVSEVADGIKVGAALENLQAQGSLIGMMSYAGESVAAHITVGANGAASSWAVHAGAEVKVDMYKFLVAVGFDGATGLAQNGWDVVASVEAKFDMFTLAASVGASNDGAGPVTTADNMEFSVSAAAAVTDTVTIKLGASWDDHDTTTATDEQWKIAGQLVAKVTETITLTGEIGVDGKAAAGAPTSVAYGSASVGWEPAGGGFSSSVTGWGNAEGAYKLTFKAAKSF
ncbi:MAG: hypothetical protein L3J15_00865 [Devosiaceae bacterium]|nr:hypothetical protein [Devosiaceae bacterium]